jgi:hypothetical protein
LLISREEKIQEKNRAVFSLASGNHRAFELQERMREQMGRKTLTGTGKPKGGGHGIKLIQMKIGMRPVGRTGR